MRVAGKSISEGIGAHANSVIEFDLPAGFNRFLAQGGLDNGGTDQGACGHNSSVQFMVYTGNPGSAVLTSIGGAGPLIDVERAQAALEQRRRRPLFFIDIGVPRNVDPEVDRLDNAYLYDIDDLQQVSERNAEERRREAAHPAIK